MNKPLYYQNCLIQPEDFSDLSERFRVPYDTVAEVIEQMQEDGFPNWASYTGTIRQRIGQMVDNISLEPEKPSEEAQEESVVESPKKEQESLEPLPVSEEDDIVEHAAISLMQAMSETKTGSFIITEDGICTINKSSPPSLIESYEVVANVLKLRDLAPKMEDKTSWMLGSIIDELENLHGENFEVGQVAETTDKSLNTIWTTVSVYRAFKKKRYKLSFSSHKEAFHQKIPDESKHLILHKA